LDESSYSSHYLLKPLCSPFESTCSRSVLSCRCRRSLMPRWAGWLNLLCFFCEHCTCWLTCLCLYPIPWLFVITTACGSYLVLIDLYQCIHLWSVTFKCQIRRDWWNGHVEWF
jgi:hypothetical protein